MVGPLGGEWIEYKEKETSPNNAKKLAWAYNTYYRDNPIVKKKITSLKVITVKEWFLDQIKEFQLTSRKFLEMKSVLNQLLDYAVEKEIVQQNVYRNVPHISYKHFKPKKKEILEEQVYLDDEPEKYVQACREQYDKTKNSVYLALGMNMFLGLRAGELVALKSSDFNEYCVHIERTEIAKFVKKNGKTLQSGYEVANYTKTPESVRDVPLTSIAKEFFEKLVIANKDSEYLVIRSDGKRATTNSVASAHKTVNEMIGTTHKGSHKLRKTYSSRIKSSGLLEDEDIKTVMGHVDISTTYKSYIHSTKKFINNLDKFEEALCGDLKM